jgi:hypothetical protein
LGRPTPIRDAKLSERTEPRAIGEGLDVLEAVFMRLRRFVEVEGGEERFTRERGGNRGWVRFGLDDGRERR